MTYETLGERNISEGLQVVFVYVNDVTGGLFINLILFGIFLIIMLGSYFAQSKSDKQNMSVSFAVAGYFITGLAVLLSLVDGLINNITLGIVITISVIGTFWLIMDGSTQ